MSCSKQNSNVPFRIRSTYRGNGPRATKWWREEKATGVWKAETMNNAGMLHAFTQDPGFEMSKDNAWGERGKVRNHSTQEDTKNGLIQTRRKCEACRLWLDTVERIMPAETHTQGLCLSVNVTVRQETIPTLMSKDTEIITHQSTEHPQTQPAVLGGKAGAAWALHVTNATPQLSKKKKQKKKTLSLFRNITMYEFKSLLCCSIDCVKLGLREWKQHNSSQVVLSSPG